jgi:hypothetical protein|tara:strand:- start:148 stop:309 length:162 start_codon:yes stop_codon:yes gene_type:complete
MKIKVPLKFLKAYDNFINTITTVLGDHITAIEPIDLGGTYRSWFHGNIIMSLC